MEIVRLRLEPDDIVVVRLPTETARKVYEQFANSFREVFPDRRVIILPLDADVEAMSLEQLKMLVAEKELGEVEQ